MHKTPGKGAMIGIARIAE
jgi:hypothetical protein